MLHKRRSSQAMRWKHGYKSVFCLDFCCFGGFQLVFSKEFCNSEVFQPICPGEGIIHVTNAIFGRREYGMCLEKEGELNEQLLKMPGYINCSTDVRHIIEPQCAGQQRCELYVAKIKSNTSCLTFALKHLEVSHECVRSRCFDCEFEMVPLY